jgi:hypothetical protein
MPQPPHDPLEPRPVRPQKGHLYVLALAAVSPLTTALVVRLTIYTPAHAFKLLGDLHHWGWVRPSGDELVITPLGRKSLAEMVEGAQLELAGRNPFGNP